MEKTKTKVVITTGKITRGGRLRLDYGNNTIEYCHGRGYLDEYIGMPIELVAYTYEEIGGSSPPVVKGSK